MSSIKDFTLEISELKFVGNDLSQPESVIAEKNGTLWVSDKRGTVTRINPDGTHTILGASKGEPNGLAMDRDGNLYVANLENGNLVKLYRDGREEVILDAIDGQPLGAVNFPFIDSKDRLWVSVTTRRQPWFLAAADPQPDGYVILIDEKGARIVADNLLVANEVRLDAEEKYLYVAETMARRVVRYPVHEDGSLGEQEVYGPSDFGLGAFTDGITFDADGNLWVSLVSRNGLAIITPDGDWHMVFEEANEEALQNMMNKIKAGELTPPDFFACAGKTIQFPTSVTFAGDDLKTVYMGSLAMPHLITFKAPVAGLPMRHWQ